MKFSIKKEQCTNLIISTILSVLSSPQILTAIVACPIGRDQEKRGLQNFLIHYMMNDNIFWIWAIAHSVEVVILDDAL